MVKHKEVLESIAVQFESVPLDELTVLDRNILRLATEALNWSIGTNEYDEIILKKG